MRKISATIMALFLLTAQGMAADPFRAVFPANLQVLSNSTGPGPGGPSGPGPYHVANMSSQAQRRWMRVTVPAPFAAQLPDICKFVAQDEALAYKGRVLGPIGTEFHVLGNVAGFGTQNGRLEAGSANVPPFQFSEWITDDPSKMEMTLRVVRNSVGTSIPFEFVETLEQSPVVRTDRYRARPRGGVWGEVFLTFYTRQDTVRVQGRFGWCDQQDPSWFTHFESIELLMGEEWQPYFATRSGAQPVAGGWQLFSNAERENGKFPHGMAPHFYGVILPKSDIPSTANPPDRVERLAWMEAAKEGDLLMTGGDLVWEGNWFALGEVPKIPPHLDGVAEANASATKFRNDLESYEGGFWAVRPLGNAWNTGGTGDQPPFGATKGTFACTVGDPRYLDETLYSSTDAGLRHTKFVETDGTRVMAANHPGLIFYDGYHDWRIGATDLLGKAGGGWPPWAWDFERGGWDSQHGGQNNLWAAGALTGSWLIQEEALSYIQNDITRPEVRRTSADAPRSLRMMQDFAKIYFILPRAQDHADLMMLMGWRLNNWETQWAGGGINGPVKPMNTVVDPRVLGGERRGFVPWNEGLGLLGMLEARALMRKLGRTDLQTRYETFIRRVVPTHLGYSMVRDNQNQLLPINGVHFLADGQPQPAAYYNIYAPSGGYRPGVTTTSPRPDTDMLLGDAGWFNWWSGIINGTLLLFPSNSPEYQAALEIKNMYFNPVWSLNSAEWHAVGQ